MLKTIKIIIITFILSLFTFSYVYAMDINMDVSNNTTSSTLQSSNPYHYDSTDYSVSSSSIPEQDLGFSNVLNIILITIGILIILLGIAILIRLKQ